MKLLIFILLFTSCGRIPQPFYNGESPPQFIDPYFQPLLNQFKTDADQRHIPYATLSQVTVIKFGEPLPGRVAECRNRDDTTILYSNHWREIVFRPDTRNYPEYLMYKLFLHEIGHCVYNLEHSSDPAAIMFADFLWTPQSELNPQINVYFNSINLGQF